MSRQIPKYPIFGTTLTVNTKNVLQLVFRSTKFNLVAWMGMIVNSACLYLFKGILHIPIIPAGLLAIEIAIIHNFLWHRYWTWNDRNGENPKSFFKHLLIYNSMTGLVDLVANITVLWSLTTFAGVHFMISNLCGMMLGPFIKFWLNEKVIFKGRKA
ncbi:GtrA family protein [bacterium]|nr:GtrA family protein [bacterium]MBU1882015.1 GtrA family protein [bacterium]